MPLNPSMLGLFDLPVRSWIEGGGYFALFGVLFCCGLGLPVPEDGPLLVAGALVARGKLGFGLAAICAWCGIVGGDVVLYHLGKVLGMEVRRLPMIGRHLSQKRLDQAHAMFERWGVWVIVVGRMFAGIRGAMVVVAGTIRFTFWKFLVADGLAALVSGGLFLALGYLFGSRMHELRRHVERGKMWALIVCGALAIVAGIWLLVRRQIKKKSSAQPDAGPTGSPEQLLPRIVKPNIVQGAGGE
jgi:membrane protein DedA with SNARE-associated domain